MAKVIHLSKAINRKKKEEENFISRLMRGLRWGVAVPVFSVALGFAVVASGISGVCVVLFELGKAIAGRTPKIRFHLKLTLPEEDA